MTAQRHYVSKRSRCVIPAPSLRTWRKVLTLRMPKRQLCFLLACPVESSRPTLVQVSTPQYRHTVYLCPLRPGPVSRRNSAVPAIGISSVRESDFRNGSTVALDSETCSSVSPEITLCLLSELLSIACLVIGLPKEKHVLNIRPCNIRGVTAHQPQYRFLFRTWLHDHRLLLISMNAFLAS